MIQVSNAHKDFVIHFVGRSDFLVSSFWNLYSCSAKLDVYCTIVNKKWLLVSLELNFIILSSTSCCVVKQEAVISSESALVCSLVTQSN